MDSKQKTSCVIIPARYKSTRFPGKPLVILNGKPMIIWVAERAALAVGLDHVFIATDDKRISDVVSIAGFKVIMTDSELLTGTDRVAQASEKLDYDIIVNLQGDEPMVNPNDIIKCVNEKIIYQDMVINGYTFISDLEQKESLNIPKVVMNEKEQLLYISRSLIPGSKDPLNAPLNYYKQVCIYAYSKVELLKFLNFGRKGLSENFEDIEILRFFELDIKIKMFSCSSGSLAVDTPEDVRIVEKALYNNEHKRI